MNRTTQSYPIPFDRQRKSEYGVSLQDTTTSVWGKFQTTTSLKHYFQIFVCGKICHCSMCLGMHVKIKVSRWIEIHHHRDCMVLFETVPDHCTRVVSIVFQDLIYTEFDRLSLKKNRPKQQMVFLGNIISFQAFLVQQQVRFKWSTLRSVLLSILWNREYLRDSPTI